MSEEELRERCRRQASEINNMREVLERKNRELDAMHYVWCDGGCPGGVHRWTEGTITKDTVEHAERQARRLRNWYHTVEFRLARPDKDSWLTKYAERAAAKTDLPRPEPTRGRFRFRIWGRLS